MKVLRDPKRMRAWAFEQKAAGRSIGLVPTMGALHEGHISLMRAARAENDAAVLSIFVNPTQFAPHEDFDQYPRTWETDSTAAAECGMDVIYAPTVSAMYPEGYATYVDVEGVSEGLCGGSRPHFFRGVATVVCKLFNAVLPDRAYFGQKDGQQCAVVQRMARDLDLGVEIVVMPIVREPDGLAMSSRNRYLGPEDRRRALCIGAALRGALARLEAGERDAATLTALVRDGMKDVNIDYVELVNAQTMKPVARVTGDVMLAVAANVGPARLIDNITFSACEAAPG